MQRNIFGHGIYQIIVLIVIIFTAPGWLCEPYWNRCVTETENDAGEVVCEWNPFYADGPYYMDPEGLNGVDDAAVVTLEETTETTTGEEE
jgi:hypothetical protein